MNEISTAFQIPNHLNAHIPAEQRGLRRDQVKMMVVGIDRKPVHSRFDLLDQFLNSGDVLVLNKSRTIPPVLRGSQGNNPIEIRLSRKLSTNQWEALVLGRVINRKQPIYFPDGVTARIAGMGSERPLVSLTFSETGSSLFSFIYDYGDPIRYEYIDYPWPLDTYQTVYGSVPGSAEMPSAGRAFTWKMIKHLKAKGIKIAFLHLHTGLSYYEDDRWPDPKNHPEPYHVPLETVKIIQQAKAARKRIIAVGTTVVRALETSVNEEGNLYESEGNTSLYVDQHYKHAVVDGLLTGFHEPEASHLDMLSSFLPANELLKAYEEALQNNYLWHEFGDMNLLFSSSDQS
ncbi:S-adenosylmethionine:tRNA ribosyltransferase-isomerase [Halobacillus mangrovi]|uniref:S-adenosylmethionine tRNA ribosyltransferase n=1 Tax=Halobacillus mangrovi TaxID=402384 RepID=A0A1W5ZVX8_9BACI|nr:S-adenosylmethionine:tRNA ribosyltransferase-isomerase [Halobacillus mangrovi]ARI77401.1 S-adenosylmethionine tRNA ribosyltransferase [Halobacillus mangrovi]